MKNWTKRLLAMVLAGMMVFSLAACGGDGSADTGATGTGSTDTGSTNTGTTNTGSTGTGTDEASTYTYNVYMEASPINWNPHAWEMNNESDLMSYIDPGLVDITIADDGVNYTWVYEGADSITDITATFADKEKWGITENEHVVYEIKLNQDAKWQNGDPIDAHDWVYSAQQLLDPAMKNYRANSYFGSSAVAIRNAEGYYYNDKVGQPIFTENMATGEPVVTADTWTAGADGVYVDANGNPLYFAIDAALNTWLGGDTLKTYVEAYGEQYFNLADWDALVALVDEDGLVPMTDETIGYMATTVTTDAWGETEADLFNYVYYVSGTYEETPWEDVGLYAADDYTLIYILENPNSMFYFMSNVTPTATWLVHEATYEAGKSTVEGLVATDYCTSAETSMSWGPYMIASFEKDKQLVLTRNENWYGWTDGEHEGQFQTTDIVIDVVADHNTQMQLFLQGQLDSVSLTSDDLTTYRMSDYLLKTDQTYTFRYIFATDLTALIALEDKAGDGANKRVLAYDDFRKAISLAMDRATYAAEATPGYKPAYYLLNYLYYYDIENNAESQYRNTTAGMEAVLNLYGIEYGAGTNYATVEEAYNAVSGYDLEAARDLFQSVYEQAIADGNYTDGQPININCMATASPSLNSDDTRQQDLLNVMVAAATEGTGFEGKITFTFQCGSTTRYDDVAAGKIEMIRGAWGGAAFYPFSTIRVYCNTEYMGGLALIHESCGWNPSTETLDMTYDFDGDGTEETLTKTFEEWSNTINGGGEYVNNPETCLFILSRLETGILGTYQCIPWSTETVSSMFSQKVEMATLNYNIMYGYGGIRLMTYNYDDAAWDEYVASQGGTLSYE